jgi:hypothetical protein
METITETKTENQLVKIINESGLDKTKAQVLLENFNNYFELAADWENKAKTLTVTDVKQVAEMKMAREGRLFLSQKRIDVEKTRKALKENSLREGQTIDAIAKILTNLILPIEEDLKNKEKFAEIQEANRRAELKARREAELEPFREYVPFANGFDTMPEEEFQKLLTYASDQKKAKEDADRKAEADRIAKEKAEAEERERIRLENERLKKEAEAKEKAMQAEREKAAKALADQQAKAEGDRRALEEKARKERETANTKLKAEQEAARIAQGKAAAEKAKLEGEIKAKAEAEAKTKREAEEKAAAELKAKQEAEKKAAAAPDKEKLFRAVTGVNLAPVTVTSKEAVAVQTAIIEKLEGFKKWALTQIETL